MQITVPRRRGGGTTSIFNDGPQRGIRWVRDSVLRRSWANLGGKHPREFEGGGGRLSKNGGSPKKKTSGGVAKNLRGSDARRVSRVWENEDSGGTKGKERNHEVERPS